MYKTQRECDEVFDNPLKSLVLGADGWFRDFRHAMERAMAGIAE